jgi:hydroxyethylthiazole kinase-like sugar kinase family protein
MGPVSAIGIGVLLVISGLTGVFADDQLPAAVQDLPEVLPWVVAVVGLITAIMGLTVATQRSSTADAVRRREP